jgi:hypothetical protein
MLEDISIEELKGLGANLKIIEFLRQVGAGKYLSVEDIADTTGVKTEVIVQVLKTLSSPLAKEGGYDWHYIKPNKTSFEEAPKVALTAEGRAMAKLLYRLTKISNTESKETENAG